MKFFVIKNNYFLLTYGFFKVDFIEDLSIIIVLLKDAIEIGSSQLPVYPLCIGQVKKTQDASMEDSNGPSEAHIM